MSSRLVNQPRLDIREQDARSDLSYPFVARNSSDGRIGSASIVFDDTRTEVFSDSVIVSMPTLLPQNSPYLASEYETTITRTGAIKGASYQYSHPRPDTKIAAFCDHNRPEQSRTTDFFLTGTEVSTGGLGFQTRLSSKSQLTIELPCVSADDITFAKSSIAYYRRSASPGFVSISPTAVMSPDDPEHQAHSIGWDAALYNAFGMPVINMEGHPAAENHRDPATTAPSAATVAAMLSYSQRSALTDANFAASGSHLLKMSEFISQPFLVEKVVIKMPLSISSHWFDLRTTIQHATTADGDWSDMGGPAIVVGLLRQERDNLREIICSGTIVPEGDNASFVHQTQCSVAVNELHDVPAGFRSFGTPACVLPGGGDFSGSVEIPMSPAVTNGFMVIKGASESLQQGTIRNVTPFGRSGNLARSGRDYFAKDLSLPKSDKAQVEYDLDVTQDVVMFTAEEVAPYLLLPTDSIIPFISTHRRVAAEVDNRAVLSGSSNTLVKPLRESDGIYDKMVIKFYGTYVQEGKENNNHTLNQQLNTANLHEIIGAEPVLDQFDISSKSVFSGSYLADIVTGSMALSTRGVIMSSVDSRLGATGSLLRGARTVCSTERYYDSLVPAPKEVAALNGSDIISYAGRFNFIQLGPGGGVGDSQMDKVWLRSYPFESRYSSLSRFSDPFANLFATREIDNAATSDTQISPKPSKSFSISYSRRDNGAKREWMLLTGHHTVPSAELSLRAYYGIGDGIVEDDGTSNIDGIPGETCCNVPRMINGIGAQGYLEHFGDIEIRGWKYGIENALPYKSSAVYSGRHHGHLRDLLEQRQDTKFFVVGKNKASSSPIKIRFTSGTGEETFSSNLSLEATSSLPYFDGVARNRGSLPAVELVGSSFT